MHISTSSVTRQVDRWKSVVSQRYKRFASSLYFLLIAVGHRKKLLVPVLLLMGMSVEFGAVQLCSLVVLGSLMLKLLSYRFANLILKTLPW